VLVLSYHNQKVELVAQREVKGAVYALEAFQGKLLCTVNSRVMLWKWAQGGVGGAGGHELVEDTSIPVQVISLYLATR
jgi:DNA damage-binding protein 1